MVNPAKEIREEFERLLNGFKVGTVNVPYYASFNNEPKSPFIYLSNLTLMEVGTKTRNGWSVSAVFDVFLRGSDAILVENIVNKLLQVLKPKNSYQYEFPSFDFLHYLPIQLSSEDGQDDGGFFLRRTVTLNFVILEKNDNV